MSGDDVTNDQIREEFLRAKVGGTAVSLRELAARHGRSYASLRQAASRGTWTKLAALALAERDAAVAEKIKRRSAETDAVLTEVVESRVQVRERHARLGRLLQDMAAERLMKLHDGELSVKVAVELLRTGLEAERVALRLDEADQHQPERMDPVLREAFKTAEAILQKYRPGSSSRPAQLLERATGGPPDSPLQSSAPGPVQARRVERRP